MAPQRWSDAALRRTSWSCWWFQLVAVLCCLPVDLAVGTNEGTWGWSGGVAQVVLDVVPLVFPLMGMAILVRQPRNRIGWVLQAVGLSWTIPFLVDAYASVGLVLLPGRLPGTDVAAAVNEGSWAPFILVMGTFLVLLFPDGRLPSQRWRPVAWASAVTMVVVPVLIAFTPGPLVEGPVPGLENPLGIAQLKAPLFVLMGVFLPLVPLCILASAASLVVRFRGARGVVRQQLKWLTLACAVVAVLYGVTMLATLLASVSASGANPGWVTALQTLSLVSFVLLPLSIGVAVLRHKLFDIDVVINRALVYAALTVSLAAVYLGSVLLLQLLLGPLIRDSDIAVAASTLAVAALFRPARGRIQASVDRRFYRGRYDAQRTLDRFGTRLRSDLDLDSVGADLRDVVELTMQPRHVALWLRPGGDAT